MKNLAPAAEGRQRPYLNLGGSDNSTSPRKPKGFNHLKTLKDISDKWASRGFYKTSDRALGALVRGDI